MLLGGSIIAKHYPRVWPQCKFNDSEILNIEKIKTSSVPPWLRTLSVIIAPFKTKKPPTPFLSRGFLIFYVIYLSQSKFQ
jgi:hypothetical protein